MVRTVFGSPSSVVNTFFESDLSSFENVWASMPTLTSAMSAGIQPSALLRSFGRPLTVSGWAGFAAKGFLSVILCGLVFGTVSFVWLRAGSRKR